MAEQQLKVRVSADVAQAVTGMKQVGSAANALPGSLNRAGSAAKKTGTDFTNLSRVVQDLPFGFIGIQNNLTQLVPNIGAMGLALSAVVTTVTFAQMGFGAWTKGLGTNTKAVNENASALQGLINQAEDAKQAIDDITAAISYSNKIGKLNLQLGFGKSLKTDLEDLRGQSTENLAKITKLRQEEAEAFKRLSDVTGRLIPSLNEGQLELFREGTLDAVADDLKEGTQKVLQTYNQFDKDLGDIRRQITEAERDQNIIYREIALQKVDISIEAAKKEEEARKKAAAAAKKIKYDYHFIVPVTNIEFPTVDEISKAVTHLGLRLSAPVDVPMRVNIAPEINSVEALKGVDKLYEKLIAVRDFLDGALTPAFEGMFSEILEGENVFESLGKAVADTVKKLIAQLAALAAVSAILSLMSGGTASFATLFKAGTKKIFGFSEGGIVPGSGNRDSVHTMLTPGELVIPKKIVKQLSNRGSSSSLGGGNRMPAYLPAFELRGDTLRAWYAQANHNEKLYG